MIVEAVMIIESDYHGYRFEVVARNVKGAWDAEVRIRRPRQPRAPDI